MTSDAPRIRSSQTHNGRGCTPDGVATRNAEPAEIALRRKERELRDFVENATVAMHWVGSDGAILWANRTELEMLGYALEEYIGRNIAEFHIDAPVIEDILSRLASGEVLDGYQARLRCKDGSVRNVAINSSVYWEDGKFIHTRCFTRDITAQKQAEASLARRAREQTALCRLTDRLHRATEPAQMYEAALDGIIEALGCDRASILLFDDGGVMRFIASRGLSESYRRAVEGHSPWRPDETAPHPITIPDVAQGDLPELLRRVVLDEGIRALSFIPLTERQSLVGKFMVYRDAPHAPDNAETDLALTIARQLAFGMLRLRSESERAKAEQALRERERRFREMIDALPAAIYTTGAEGRLTHYNPACVELSGRVPELDTDCWCVSLRLYHPDGTPMPHDQCPMAVTMRTGRAVRGAEVIVERPDGSRAWVTPYPTPLLDAEGRVAGGINMLVDITERRLAEEELRRHREHLEALVEDRTAELEASHRQLRLTERMAAIGTLSAGLGHDMGNLLLPIRVHLESLAKGDLPDNLQGSVEAIRTSAEYLRKLATALRQLALDPTHAAGAADTELCAWWDEVEPMLRNALPRGIPLDSCGFSEPCWVRIASPALTQSVFNLVQNAGDAMRERAGGRVTVWAEGADGAVRICVTDDGPGMPPEVKSRCLEPFFTTKTRGISTGMGLSLVYGLVTDAGGSVHIESERARGSTFVLSLRPGSAPSDSHTGRTGRTACLEVRDARLRALVTAELRSLSFDLRPRGACECPDVVVLDDEAALNGPAGGSPVVLLASGGERGGVLAIGDRPSPRIIREALIKLTAPRGEAE